MNKENNPLAIDFFNGKLENPLILGSGTLAEKYEDIDKFIEAGAGGVIPRTTRKEMIRKQHPSPHLYQFGNQSNETILNSEWTGADIDYWRPYLEQMSSSSKVIMSVSGRDVKGCVDVCKILDEYKFPLLEINLSCAHSNNVHGFITRNSEHIKQITGELKKNIQTPIGIKLGHSDFIVELSQVAQDEGADAIVAINTLGPVFDFTIDDNLNPKPVLGIENAKGGLSGMGLFNIALTDIADISKCLGIPVIGCGGVRSAEDVIKMIMAGACAVEIYTAAHVRGIDAPSIFTEIRKNLIEILTKHNLSNIHQLQGRALSLLDQKTNLEVKIPKVNLDSCQLCGDCIRICLKDAISIKREEGNSKLEIDQNNCVGCGHCVSVCQRVALTQY